MGNPTVYRMPRKGMPAKKPTDEAKRKWRKHREALGKDTTLPKLK